MQALVCAVHVEGIQKVLTDALSGFPTMSMAWKLRLMTRCRKSGIVMSETFHQAWIYSNFAFGEY